MTRVLELRDVAKRYGGKRAPVWALAGVSLTLEAGETLGIVGESGSGKSTIARIAVGLETPTSGQVIVGGGTAGAGARSAPIQMVFQDPAASLDPLLRIATSVDEPLKARGGDTAAARSARVAQALQEVGLGEEGGGRHPDQLSGGQKQRASIARALAALPPVIICDEAVTALDVSIRAQVLNLLRRVQQAHGTACLFISHDLCTVAYMSDRIMVMYLGRVMEVGTTAQLFAGPAHPYTYALLSAVPTLQQGTRTRVRLRLAGDPPSVMNLPTGCRFHTRCPRADARCREEPPALRELAPAHYVACHYAPVAESALVGAVPQLPGSEAR
jgi:oligopeptide/dipeptide ABC transporter ATP-binding protein